jgi:tripeptidyl-peptidase II
MSATVSVTREKREISLLSGRKLACPDTWFDRNGAVSEERFEFRVGLKAGADLYTPRGLSDRVAKERKADFVRRHTVLVERTRQAVVDLEKAAKRDADQEAEFKSLKTELEVLEASMESYDDAGPFYDVVVFREKEGIYRVAVISEEVDAEDPAAVASIPLLTDYRRERQFSQLDSRCCVNFSVNIWEDGARVELVTPSSSHGTHVAGIIGAYYGEEGAASKDVPGGGESRNGLA